MSCCGNKTGCNRAQKPVAVNVHPNELEIKFEICRFGSNHNYSLRIPVADKASRREMVKQLRIAADKLEANLNAQLVSSDQKLLPFAQ